MCIKREVNLLMEVNSLSHKMPADFSLLTYLLCCLIPGLDYAIFMSDKMVKLGERVKNSGHGLDDRSNP